MPYGVYCRVRQIAYMNGMTEYNAKVNVLDTEHYDVTLSHSTRGFITRQCVGECPMRINGVTVASSGLDGLYLSKYMRDYIPDIHPLYNHLAGLIRYGADGGNAIAYVSPDDDRLNYTYDIDTAGHIVWLTLVNSYTQPAGICFTYKEVSEWLGADPREGTISNEDCLMLLKEMGEVYTEVMKGAVGLEMNVKSVYHAIDTMQVIREKAH
jgi:hypothetical protein